MCFCNRAALKTCLLENHPFWYPFGFCWLMIVRPQKWEDSQVGFGGSNASGRRIVLLPDVFWAHGAFKMAILGASFLLCILQCFRVWDQARVAWAMLPPGALFRAGAFAFLPCAPKSHLLPLPHLGPSEMRPMASPSPCAPPEASRWIFLGFFATDK